MPLECIITHVRRCHAVTPFGMLGRNCNRDVWPLVDENPYSICSASRLHRPAFASPNGSLSFPAHPWFKVGRLGFIVARLKTSSCMRSASGGWCAVAPRFLNMRGGKTLLRVPSVSCMV